MRNQDFVHGRRVSAYVKFHTILLLNQTGEPEFLETVSQWSPQCSLTQVISILRSHWPFIITHNHVWQGDSVPVHTFRDLLLLIEGALSASKFGLQKRWCPDTSFKEELKHTALGLSILRSFLRCPLAPLWKTLEKKKALKWWHKVKKFHWWFVANLPIAFYWAWCREWSRLCQKAN